MQKAVGSDEHGSQTGTSSDLTLLAPQTLERPRSPEDHDPCTCHLAAWTLVVTETLKIKCRCFRVSVLN